MRPADYELGWFTASTVNVDAIRDAAKRCAARGYGPVRVHHHACAVDCEGQRHEVVTTVEQLRLDGVELPAGVRHASG